MEFAVSVLDSVIVRIKNLAADDLRAVETQITDWLASDIPLINDMSQYIISNGGKRLRPLIVILVAHALKFSGTQHIQVAAVIELIHTATLLHDDVVDASILRRGRPTANHLWGNQASVLVGDFLYSRAFQHLIQLNQTQIMSLLAEATNTIAAGEVLQLSNCGNLNIDEALYLKTIHAKTAILFSAAAQSAALLCTDSSAMIKAMAEFGTELGMAFQLIDDLLDYTGSSDEMGKNDGDDLLEGKITLPLIHFLKKATKQQQEQVVNILVNKNPQDFPAIKKEIVSSDAIAYTYQLAEQLFHYPLHPIVMCLSKYVILLCSAIFSGV
jgi:octaprenyl-diphosphate synthase